MTKVDTYNMKMFTRETLRQNFRNTMRTKKSCHNSILELHNMLLNLATYNDCLVFNKNQKPTFKEIVIN